MKRTIMITLIALISVILMFCTPLYSKAISLDEVLQAGDNFLDNSTSNPNIGNTMPSEEKMAEISDTVSSVLLSVAVAVTFISAVIMAINFVIQSVEDKAKIKESMVPWIIGIVVSFGAYGIWRITLSVFDKL